MKTKNRVGKCRVALLDLFLHAHGGGRDLFFR